MSNRKLPDTSHAANKAATEEMRRTHYGKIISALKVLGSGIYEQIADYCGMDKHQVGRRLSEMEGLQLVWKPGAKKPTKSNRMAYVYQLTGDSQPKTENEAVAYRKDVKNAADYASGIINSKSGSFSVQNTLFTE